jgi:hypothetical protein
MTIPSTRRYDSGAAAGAYYSGVTDNLPFGIGLLKLAQGAFEAGQQYACRCCVMSRSKLFAVALGLVACSGNKGPEGGGLGGNPSVAGMWIGSEGPNPNALKPTAQLQLTVDGGEVIGIWYSKDPTTGNPELVAFLGGTQDGGTIYLVTNPQFGGGQLGPGAPFTVNVTSPTHLEATTQTKKRDGGILPIYLKLDRSQ